MKNPKPTHVLNLTFKGKRNYLHGTDIIPALLEIAGPLHNLSVQLHRKTSHELKAHMVDKLELSQMRKEGDICALMSYEISDGQKKYIAVTEDLSIPIKRNQEFDEEKVIKFAIIQEQSIIQEKCITGTLIERIVALNKSLLTELIEHSSWLFCGLELKTLPNHTAPLSITFKSKFGRGLYKSVIIADGQELGSLTFVENITS